MDQVPARRHLCQLFSLLILNRANSAGVYIHLIVLFTIVHKLQKIKEFIQESQLCLSEEPVQPIYFARIRRIWILLSSMELSPYSLKLQKLLFTFSQLFVFSNLLPFVPYKPEDGTWAKQYYPDRHQHKYYHRVYFFSGLWVELIIFVDIYLESRLILRVDVTSVQNQIFNLLYFCNHNLISSGVTTALNCF